MTIGTIGIAIGTAEDTPALRNFVTSLAKKHGATVRAVYPLYDNLLPARILAEVPGDILETHRAQLKTEAEEQRTEIMRLFGAAQVPVVWDAVPVYADQTVERVISQLRPVDLIVVGQHDSSAAGLDTLLDGLMLDSGRPVLAVPFIGSGAAIGQKVLMAWTDTRESMRAIHDALPLIEPGAQVTLFTLASNEGKVGGLTATGSILADVLRRHGLEVRAQVGLAGGVGTGDAILNAVADRGCDLLVMGGYGHSRLRELVLGGATRHMLHSMTVPVCFSH